MNLKNKDGLIGLAFGIASAFLYQLLLLQLIAIFFSYRGIKSAKHNPLLPKWQCNTGMILGCIYVFMFLYQFIPNYVPQ